MPRQQQGTRGSMCGVPVSRGCLHIAWHTGRPVGGKELLSEESVHCCLHTGNVLFTHGPPYIFTDLEVLRTIFGWYMSRYSVFLLSEYINLTRFLFLLISNRSSLYLWYRVSRSLHLSLSNWYSIQRIVLVCRQSNLSTFIFVPESITKSP